MPPGIDLSGVAIISSITWPAAVRRSATFALSPSACADREPAIIAKPHRATEIFLNIIVIPFTSIVLYFGGGPTNCLFPTIYKTGKNRSRLYLGAPGLAYPIHDIHTQKNG